MRASAPGKLIIAGEYAVLRGGSAVVCAIDRRAVAADASEPEPLSPFLAEVVAQLGRDAGALRVDTTAFSVAGRKLGLGSSAAATVAFAGALAPELTRGEVYALAHRAHGAVSARAGARGSGVDVAASIHGGVIRATARGSGPPEVEALALPRDLVLVAVDSGAPADTRELVAAVMATATDTLLQRIASAADSLAKADSAAAAIGALAAGMDAIAAVGDATGVALVTPVLERIAKLAAARGGAAKPTGAAGGDVAIAGFASVADAQLFRDDLMTAHISALELGIDKYGLLQNTPSGGMVPGC